MYFAASLAYQVGRNCQAETNCACTRTLDSSKRSDQVREQKTDHLLPSFPYDQAIVDLHVADDRVEIIELSPFASNVGACMFSWKKEKDAS